MTRGGGPFPIAKPRGTSSGLSPDHLAVTLTIGQLRQLVQDAVGELLAQQPAAGAREVLNLEQVAELLGRHPRTIKGLIEERALPVHYISDREPRFKRSEVLAWMNTLPTRPAGEAQP